MPVTLLYIFLDFSAHTRIASIIALRKPRSSSTCTASIDAVVSASGSSPAYVFMMIEAMADAAVADGMPRPQAYKFAAQAVMGSAKMVLETGKHPGELKDMVCSPASSVVQIGRASCRERV